MYSKGAHHLLQQTSAFHERDILFQARQSRVQHAPWLIAAEHDTTHLHILLQYLPSGDIGLLLSERKVLPLRWVRFWAAEATQAIIWLHELGYAHRYVSLHRYRTSSPVYLTSLVLRDIKPANILLDTSGHAKLADFASAGPLISSSSDAATVMKKYCLAPVGTVDYVSRGYIFMERRSVILIDDADCTRHPARPREGSDGVG
jgi:serine/threonine protein kinase